MDGVETIKQIRAYLEKAGKKPGAGSLDYRICGRG